MELFKEILAKVFTKEEIHVSFPNLNMNIEKIIEMECYEALNKVKVIIENDKLSDFECVEEIVCVLEEIGSNGGNRHDFG